MIDVKHQPGLRQRPDRKVRKGGLQRSHKAAAVVHDTRIGVDLEGNGHAVICIMAQAGNMGGNPAAMAISRAARGIGVDCIACTITDAWSVRITGTLSRTRSR